MIDKNKPIFKQIDSSQLPENFPSFHDFDSALGDFYEGNEKENKKVLFRSLGKILGNFDTHVLQHELATPFGEIISLVRSQNREIGIRLNKSFAEELKKGSGKKEKCALIHYYLLCIPIYRSYGNDMNALAFTREKFSKLFPIEVQRLHHIKHDTHEVVASKEAKPVEQIELADAETLTEKLIWKATSKTLYEPVRNLARLSINGTQNTGINAPLYLITDLNFSGLFDRESGYTLCFNYAEISVENVSHAQSVVFQSDFEIGQTIDKKDCSITNVGNLSEPVFEVRALGERFKDYYSPDDAPTFKVRPNKLEGTFKASLAVCVARPHLYCPDDAKDVPEHKNRIIERILTEGEIPPPDGRAFVTTHEVEVKVTTEKSPYQDD